MIPDRPITPEDLLPGDILLYKPGSLLGWLIALKTWERVCHVEVFAGRANSGLPESYASRDGIGVDRYPFRHKGLVKVLRAHPREEWQTQPFNHELARRYFRQVRYQKYDWKGLLVFTLAVKQGAHDRQFCSEFARNLLHAGGVEAFNQSFPSDQVAPATFLSSLAFDEPFSIFRSEL